MPNPLSDAALRTKAEQIVDACTHTVVVDQVGTHTTQFFRHGACPVCVADALRTVREAQRAEDAIRVERFISRLTTVIVEPLVKEIATTIRQEGGDELTS